ncbi:hypothetical protein WICPIJ_005106 [Wickerhamomyces pijperi]|uniref:Golgi apyrase n=1 Tax=Wickerhamomyces pijperi TaxID=599730 RepID=A0A9P8Q4H6_WICPI|nr:hypothetical protein WICPIJ_005106 [Wickerhamomyces pijperi]
MVKQHYGIVIDSGSSGSRIQIYRWDDSTSLQQDPNTDSSLLRSVPQIYQEETWTKKTTPGVSTFGDNIGDVYDGHYEDLIKYAEKIIPKESWEDTPIFVLATAGMRLLPTKKQEGLLSQICQDLQKHSHFKIENCDDQVQIIDGETEGLYGWIGLNYLKEKLNDYDHGADHHESYGFMDMGGASTQISFVPNKQSEIERHSDDISSLYLRNVNGDVQEWRVFVSTWLGFGANESRKRYLKTLINMLPEKNNNNDEDDFNTLKINDPCLPKGAKFDYLYNGETYEFSGSGNYEQCLKTTYPLLLKNLPCIDEPCLFNGVHAPEIDFYKDKFIGISEYWYTANDVFHMGGEYNFLKFSEHVKTYCDSPWSEIQENSKNGEYNGVSDRTLLDACFKANWVLNVLHEGFNLPRAGIETEIDSDSQESKFDDGHIPFQSASSIKGSELSWTLGRILLYASSLIVASDDKVIGIQPSSNQQRDFINGGLVPGSLFRTISSTVESVTKHGSSREQQSSFTFLSLLVFLLFFFVLFYFASKHHAGTRRLLAYLTNFIHSKLHNYNQIKVFNQELDDLESGNVNITTQTIIHNDGGPVNKTDVSGSISPSLSSNQFNIRTRSAANLSPRLDGVPHFSPNGNSANTSSPLAAGAAGKARFNLYNSNSLVDFGKFSNGKDIGGSGLKRTTSNLE